MRSTSHTIATPFKIGDYFDVTFVHSINEVFKVEDGTTVTAALRSAYGSTMYEFKPTDISVGYLNGIITVNAAPEETINWVEGNSELIAKFTLPNGRVYQTNKIRIHLEE